MADQNIILMARNRMKHNPEYIRQKKLVEQARAQVRSCRIHKDISREAYNSVNPDTTVAQELHDLYMRADQLLVEAELIADERASDLETWCNRFIEQTVKEWCK